MKLLFITILPLISCDQTCTTTSSSSCDNEEVQFWHKYTIDEFFHHFDCHALLPGYTNDYDGYDDAAHPPPPSPRALEERELNPNELQKTMQIVERIRSKYISDVHPASIGDAEQLFESVFKVPIMVGDSGLKGRGVYAKQDISRGTLMLDVENKVGVFNDAMQWRTFTYELGVQDAETACNFIEWCWIQNVEKKDNDDDNETREDDNVRYEPTVFVAFDESGLINNAEWGEEEANVRCGVLLDDERDTWSACRFQYHASKDIAAGDELLMNYSEIEDEDQHGWVEFGVGIGLNI